MGRGLRRITFFLVFLVLWFLISDAVFTVNTKPLQPADLIIVLGNPVNADGTIGLTQKSRAKAGIDLYKKGLAKKILFTGGAAVNRFIESEAMKQYALENKVPAKDILTETRSINTIQNAFYSNFIIQKQQAESLIIVTSSYHTLRAKHVFKPYANNPQMKAVYYPKELGFKYRVKAMFYEYAAWLYYSFYGWDKTKPQTGMRLEPSSR